MRVFLCIIGGVAVALGLVGVWAPVAPATVTKLLLADAIVFTAVMVLW